MTAVTDIIDELNDSSLSSTRLRELCLQLRKKTDTGCAITVSDEVNLIESLSYHSISPGVDIQINTDVLQTIDYYFQRNKSEHDEIMCVLISKLQPLLLKRKSNFELKEQRNLGLKPTLGMSSKEDNLMQAWVSQGGLKGIPLFYVILLHLKRRDISTNLSWIIPGILNILDDTTDIRRIKLRGVLLLQTLLNHTFMNEINDSKWIQFSSTGLFPLFEKTLINMCYFLPPSYNADETIAIWRVVFPTIQSLYRVEFWDNYTKYQYHLEKFMSEIILQNIIPRASLAYENLTLYALECTMNILRLQREGSVVHLQRLIFVLGEYIVRNPFYTTFPRLISKTLSVVSTLIKVCPNERIVAHRFDILSLILVTYDKCSQEDALNKSILQQCKETISWLLNCDCAMGQQLSALSKQPRFQLLFEFS
ncbi:CRE_HP_G0147140.mRNA.1.CDS.1 [Saccharomyces cerevisiae]|nr:CRE_HP_G0036740.mRNA.1.CDS.1 [Saccharomyces cerevisiae]CAI5070863.1 CRE_HP_G0117300.mRNA.1.CDS.1 [Saccharomyces cerevisiae]CAI5163503.1 CRE_HP_G0147140.mRNA.1.CDS.1 [Saccharomyces cerevisiae]CAI6610447.1 CRE_HP_G0036740.mRNA.1.CDS.1 [Saccharomyces cerevisiae]CAI6964336.1 CRE_HP_G0117300.mRNA.1.CDS.1 [Saccharomyces cerevisiae]